MALLAEIIKNYYYYYLLSMVVGHGRILSYQLSLSINYICLVVIYRNNMRDKQNIHGSD